MLRRMLSSLTILAGVLILGMLGYVFATSRKGSHAEPSGPPQSQLAGQDNPGMPPAQSSPGAAQPPAPSHAGAPSPTRANTLVAKPFPDHPELGATLVTLDAAGETAAVALGRLSDVSGIPIEPLPAQVQVPPGIRLNTVAPVSLHLVEQPFLEALMEIQAQAPVSVMSFSANPLGTLGGGRGNTPPGTLTARYETQRTVPLMWSVSGPFAFGIESMSHGMQIDANDDVSPQPVRTFRGGAGPADAVLLRFRAYTEPRIKVLTYPPGIELREAVDDRGHSLLPRPDPSALRSTQQPFTYSGQPLEVALAYPENDAGRTIKVLSGVAHYTIQTVEDVPTITLDDPANSLPVTKEFQGMQITFGKAAWNRAEQGFDMPVTYRRGSYKGDWAAFAQGAGGLKPRVTQSTGRPINSRAQYSTVTGDMATITYGIQFALVIQGPGGMQQVPYSDTAPAVENFMFDMPVGSVVLDVPVEFKDLPLP